MAKLWRELGTMLSGILAALRAFLHVLRNSPSDSHRALPAAPSQPPLELPASSSTCKVALMVVNPYLVHAYWDVDTSRLPPGTKSAVLRFHDVSEIAPGPPFDVDIDLRAPNWYVHLWSPAKSYYAALAVKTEGGQFIPLATSNRVETPRAWPAAETPAAPTEFDTSALRGARDSATRGSRADEGVRPAPVTSPSPLSPNVPPQPVHADEVLRRRLAAIYALRSFEPRPAIAMATAVSGEVPIRSVAEIPPAAHHDLTALAEHQFSPGLPSSQP